MPSTIYYHYFRMILKRTNELYTEQTNIMITSENETVNADDMRLAFKTALRNIKKHRKRQV